MGYGIQGLPRLDGFVHEHPGKAEAAATAIGDDGLVIAYRAVS